jgi:DNA polymerase/3'-5' exonuclease PolX
MTEPSNAFIAQRLSEAADLLDAQGACPFRVRAYRRAAGTVSGLDQDLAQIVAQTGIEGLDALPGIGQELAAAILELVHTGRWGLLDRLRGDVDPAMLFQTIPGVGAHTAHTGGG